jgi:hypothetical protein
MMGKEPTIPPGVTRGVDVFRGVTVGLRDGVGEGVQVGSIRMRGVALGGMGVGGAGVGDEVGVVVAQPARIRDKPRTRNLIGLMLRLPSARGSSLHSFPIQPAVFG